MTGGSLIFPFQFDIRTHVLYNRFLPVETRLRPARDAASLSPSSDAAGSPARETEFREVLVWFRRSTSQREGCLAFEVDAELSAQIRLAAHTHDQSPQALVADLLTRGLEQEALRFQAEVALKELTPREQEVAWLTGRGYTNHRIAEQLVISPETVKTHVRHILEKFEIHSKADLRLLLLDLGIRWWDGSKSSNDL